MSAVFHGGMQAEELAELGIDPVDVLDLSANLNPLGAHPHVLQTAREADLRRYPEPHATSLNEAIAARTGLDASQVLVTPGATGAIHLAAHALLNPGDDCVLWPPTFGEYAAAIAATGASMAEYRTAPPAFVPSLDVRPARLAMLCNPNNPTGTYLTRVEVETLIRQFGATLLIDVAYDPFVTDAWDADDLIRDGADVVVVHSMTKLHAVPGIRLGYVTGPAPRIAQLAALQPSWSLGAQALAAGQAMLAVDRVQREAVTEVTKVRGLLVTDLAERGVDVVEGRANFLLARVGDASAFRLALLRRGFAVRDCASFGLPEWVRIAVPVEAAARRLLTAFHAARAELSA
jgi:histidinol-phosphate/aromatic aminotransferase/cobyric acid decarboxylase-like protein